MIERLRTVRQIRQYSAERVPDDVLRRILEVARWTGSSRNAQPWHFIVVTDKARLARLAHLRTAINWLEAAPMGIVIALESSSTSVAYDEGRVTERILVAAHELGYGGGVAWFGDDAQEAEAKRILDIPSDRVAHQIVMVGRPTSTKDPRPDPRKGGRWPLEDLVSYERWGGKQK